MAGNPSRYSMELGERMYSGEMDSLRRRYPLLYEAVFRSSGSLPVRSAQVASALERLSRLMSDDPQGPEVREAVNQIRVRGYSGDLAGLMRALSAPFRRLADPASQGAMVLDNFLDDARLRLRRAGSHAMALFEEHVRRLKADPALMASLAAAADESEAADRVQHLLWQAAIENKSDKSASGAFLDAFGWPDTPKAAKLRPRISLDLLSAVPSRDVDLRAAVRNAHPGWPSAQSDMLASRLEEMRRLAVPAVFGRELESVLGMPGFRASMTYTAAWLARERNERRSSDHAEGARQR